MPELAEVEHARRLFDVGLAQPVTDVIIPNPGVRVLREVAVDELRRALTDQLFLSSYARGKQMALRFGPQGDRWLGLHLGMAGRLRVEAETYRPQKHDHLMLRQRGRCLVFFDSRHFGRVRFYQGPGEPPWWADLGPSLLDDAFTAEAVVTFLQRRRKAPLKAVLLMQERFPGVGNWMADEILWRARLHPARRAETLTADERKALWRTTRHVAREAIRVINDAWDYPATWLFAHRWEDGGACPRCHERLQRQTIGGRTTCWCPACQAS